MVLETGYSTLLAIMLLSIVGATELKINKLHAGR